MKSSEKWWRLRGLGTSVLSARIARAVLVHHPGHSPAWRRCQRGSCPDSWTFSRLAIWKRGRIESIQGVVAHPRKAKAIRAELAALDAWSPASSARLAKEDDRREALRQLKIYRCVVGVPYADLGLKAKFNHFSDAAAEICHRLGGITHEPTNPGLSAANYRTARIGCMNSNLCGGGSMRRSVESYMEDSDPSNIADVGHRRWCLNPRMKWVGFGASKTTSAMWCMDTSRKKIPDEAFISFPPRGIVPVAFFKSNYAWSISLSPRHFREPLKGGTEVRVYALDADYVKRGKPLALTNVNVSTEAYGGSPCVIFKPVGATIEPSRRYWVEVHGLTTSRGKSPNPSIQFLVEFAALKK